MEAWNLVLDRAALDAWSVFCLSSLLGGETVLLGDSLWNSLCVQEGHHQPLALLLVHMIFSEICLRLCYWCQLCSYGCSFQLEAQEASQAVGEAASPSCSDLSLRGVRGKRQWLWADLSQRSPVCLWDSGGKCSAVEKSRPVLQKVHLDAAVIWMEVCFDNCWEKELPCENKCAHANLKNNADYHSPEWSWWLTTAV